MIRFDARSATLFGSMGAAFVFVPLASFALLAEGMSDCIDCGISSFLVQAWILAALFALLVGLLAGSTAGVLRPWLSGFARPFMTIVVLTLMTGLLAWGAMMIAPPLYVSAVYWITPRQQLPPGDPRRTPSDCSKTRKTADTICAV